MLPTSLKLGRRSRLLFVDPPSARCKASLSAREGANARRREELAEGRTLVTRPFGFSAS
jgi:hypothetical protein